MKQLSRFFTLKFGHKRAGFALNIVIVFMMVSQLLYWSLIVKNQYIIRQYKQYQRHYLNQIQLLVSEKSFQTAILEQLDNFYFEVEHRIQELLNQLLTDPIDEWFIQTPQIGMAKLNTDTEDSVLCLYRIEIECDDILREYMKMNPPTWQVNHWLVVGLNQTFEIRPHEQSDENGATTKPFSEKEYNELLQTLIQMEYQTERPAIQREYLYQYRFESLPHQWDYEDGSVQLKTDASTGQTLYYLVSQQRQDESGRVSQLIFRQPYYRIKVEVRRVIKMTSAE